MRKKKRVLCYSIDRRKDYSYYKLYIRVFFALEESVVDLLEGTVDNKAGYGSPEAARSIGEHYQHLLDEGHKKSLDLGYNVGASVTMAWLELDGGAHYGPSYSDGAVSQSGSDEKYEGMVAGVGLLTRIGRSVEKILFARKENHWGTEKPEKPDNRTFSSPTMFIAGLKKLKAKQVKVLEHHRFASTWVYDKEPRMWLLSDTLLESLEYREC